MDFKALNDELSNLIGDTGTGVPGLGVIVFKDGREIFSTFLGRRIIGANSKPVTRHTRFRAASVSKIFTIFSVMQLVERGKISLDDDAGDLLGFELRNPNQPQKKITVRMLASHTSSLRDGKIYSLPPEMSIRELFQPNGEFWEDGAYFAPREEKVGEFFSYCNLNYGVLGTIVEAVTGKRFDIWQRENILRQLDTKADYLPANLSATEFEQLGALYRKKNSSGVWDEFGDWHAQLDDFGGIQPAKDTVALQNPYAENFCRVCSLKNYRVGTNATFFSPQGGLRISFDELAHALEMILNGGNFRGQKILSGESLETIFKPHWTFNPQNPNGDTCGGTFPTYGLGTHSVACQNFSRTLLGHFGDAFGMLSGLFFVPKKKSGFVYMLNGQAINPDEDPRSKGKFGGVYVWEEKILNAVCRKFFM